MIDHYKVFKNQVSISTQNELKLWYQAHKSHALLAVKEQLQGRGRTGNQWLFLPGSLAFSFTLNFAPPTLGAIAISSLFCDFFKKYELSLRLKWPNDILNDRGEKVGGIICELIENKTLLIGVGLNISPFKPADLSQDAWPASSIEPEKLELPKGYQWSLPESFLHYTQQYLSHFSTKDWEKHCFHMNKKVTLDDTQGEFIALGPCGEAIISSDEGERKLISGTLRFDLI